MLFAAVTHVHQWLGLEILLTLKVEISQICLIYTRRPEQLILFLGNKASIFCRLE
jgi:hypothetical protein